jgi:hypothetical protein
VRIAVDARTSIPLQVQVFAQNAGTPAISVGFSSVTFGTPAPGDVSYERSLGAHVTKVNLAGRDLAQPVPGLPAGVHVTGSGWLAVLEMPASLLNSALAPGTVPSSGKGAGSQTAAAEAAAAQAEAAMQSLLNSAEQVHGHWGTGQLVSTGLVNVLITNSTIYIGAVEPSVLYAAAAQS